jgi:transcription antitermination factor NusG
LKESTSLIEDGGAVSSTWGIENLPLKSSGIGPEALSPVGQSQRWFAAYTAPRHEKAVVRQLIARKVESFLPLYTSIRRWKNGCQVAVEQPLFPGYVFVHVQRPDSIRVLQVPGVVSLVGKGREPAELSSREIESLREALPQRFYEPHPLLAAGDKVRIIAGPLTGMTGVLVRQKKSLRVVLTLDLIMQSVAVEIGIDEIEPFRK